MSNEYSPKHVDIDKYRQWARDKYTVYYNEVLQLFENKCEILEFRVHPALSSINYEIVQGGEYLYVGSSFSEAADKYNKQLNTYSKVQPESE